MTQLCKRHMEEFEEDSYCQFCALEEFDLGAPAGQLFDMYQEMRRLCEEYRGILQQLTLAEVGEQGYSVSRAVQLARIKLSYYLPPKLERKK